MSNTSISIRVLAAVAAFWGMALASRPGASAQSVATWESSIGGVDTARVPGRTVRQYARISVGSDQLRIRISNESGNAPLMVSDAHMALPGAIPGSVQPSTDHQITFNGSTTITVAPGTGFISDPIAMGAKPLTRLAVSAYYRTASTVQVEHLLASETNYLAEGDHATEATMSGGIPSEAGFYLTGISAVIGNQPGGAVACLGDSITDGLYSTSDAEHRYPDRLAERLLAASQGRIGAINAGIVGNGATVGNPAGASGPSAVARLQRDVLSRPGVHWVIVFVGINDIIYPPDTGDTAAELISTYGQIIAQAHEANVRVFGATLTPFKGSGREYWSEAREAVRQRVNAWIRTSGAYDDVFDFDAAVRASADPARLAPAYDGGDHLHLSDTGYIVLSNTVTLPSIFRASR